MGRASLPEFDRQMSIPGGAATPDCLGACGIGLEPRRRRVRGASAAVWKRQYREAVLEAGISGRQFRRPSVLF